MAFISFLLAISTKKTNIYLQDTHTAFYEEDNPISLDDCTYLHKYTYTQNDLAFLEKFHKALKKV